MRNFEKTFIVILLFSVLVGTYKAFDILFTIQESEAQTQYLADQSKINYSKAKQLHSRIENYGGFKEFNERINQALAKWLVAVAGEDEALIDYYKFINMELKEIVVLIFIIITVNMLMILYLLFQLKKPNKENSHG